MLRRAHGSRRARRSARRSVTAALLALVTATGLAACGGGDEGDAAADAGTQAGAETSAFPVSIEHKYGTTEITAEPKRIVVVGLVEQDALLALGVVPVATTEWFGKYPGAVWPWAKDKLGSATPPEVLTDVDGIQFEKVAALKPDLILGVYSGLTAEQYGTLSKIAPTVAQPKGGIDWGVGWQELTRTVGKAVGKPDAAEKAVTDAEAKLKAARAANPAFEGATGLVATTYEGFYVYGADDSRGRLMTDLGFELPAGLDAVTGDQFGANLSRERTDLLNTDALVWLVDDVARDRGKLHADPLYSKLKVKAEAREVFLLNEGQLGGATSFITVLSVPYLVDNLVPRLAAAVDGNPATAAEPEAA
jgi:iron complex transport system substrate-binding protein